MLEMVQKDPAAGGTNEEQKQRLKIQGSDSSDELPEIQVPFGRKSNSVRYELGPGYQAVAQELMLMNKLVSDGREKVELSLMISNQIRKNSR